MVNKQKREKNTGKKGKQGKIHRQQHFMIFFFHSKQQIRERERETSPDQLENRVSAVALFKDLTSPEKTDISSGSKSQDRQLDGYCYRARSARQFQS